MDKKYHWNIMDWPRKLFYLIKIFKTPLNSIYPLKILNSLLISIFIFSRLGGNRTSYSLDIFFILIQYTRYKSSHDYFTTKTFKCNWFYLTLNLSDLFIENANVYNTKFENGKAPILEIYRNYHYIQIQKFPLIIFQNEQTDNI